MIILQANLPLPEFRDVLHTGWRLNIDCTGNSFAIQTNDVINKNNCTS